jgi:DNA polymerase-3 subunit alpha (Gram-positive type)
MPKLGGFVKDLSPLQSVADCELACVSFDKRKEVLTLYISSERQISFGDLSDAENIVRASLDLAEVKIIAGNTAPAPVAPPKPAPAPPKPIPAPAPTDGDVLLGKKITAPPVLMEALAGKGEVVVSGEIFAKETRELKGGKTVTIICFSDKTSSVMLKIFTGAKKVIDMVKGIGKGTSILVHGKYAYDEYEKERVIEPISIMRVKPAEKTDDYEGAKRIELHLHTKMSDMDATNSASEYVKLAHKWGHKAVAITDHGNIQAFPEAMNTYEWGLKSDPDFKVIYGIEAYFVNDGNPLISEGGNFPFSGEFVVFDLETTGLSPADNRIIEIGAVKLNNMEIVGEFSTFINPQMPIPDDASRINGITDDMVRDAPYEREAFGKLIEFCGDCKCLVGHNAIKFDMLFIRAGFARCGLECDFSAVDTLDLSRAAVPERKSHKLNLMVEHYKLGEFNHHRALDDARVTALLFKKIVSDVKKMMSVERVGDLNSAFGGIDIKKTKDLYHMMILVRNKIGLKNLYKLISYSNLYHFHGKPRIPLSDLRKHREGLLIGSACEQGELFQAVVSGKSHAELLEIAKLYDFLEIQPTGNNAFLVREGRVASEVSLQVFNKRIYDLGKELGKPVAATGDVHFMNPDDSIYREVLMTGKGFKDADQQAPLYFRTTAEMLAEFEYLGDEAAREVVIDNPHKIADLIDGGDVRPIPKGEYRPFIEGAEEKLEELCRSRAAELYGEPLHETIQKSIDKELNAIIKNGFSVLYLIAHELVKESERNGFLVGSRGSVGSSVAAFFAGISEVNPLPPHYRCPKCRYTEFDDSVGSGFDLPEKQCPRCSAEGTGSALARDGHDIPFETFMGFAGEKVPDIDLNFSGEYQSEAHEYTKKRFGEGHAYKAGTISTTQEKTIFGFIKGFEESRGITLGKAEKARIVAGCEDVKRTTGQHAGGMLIIPHDKDVYDFTPIQYPADKTGEKTVTTHFDYRSLHDTITKLDILGHDVPTLYKCLTDLTGVRIADVPTSDKQVMRLFTSTEPLGFTDAEEVRQSGLFQTGTYGLPEMGTPFVMQMLKEAEPKVFSDLLQISGLSHGTGVWLGNARDLITSKQCGISEVIGTRDNIMVYLMQKGIEPGLAFKITEITRKGSASEKFDDEIYAAFKEHGVEDWYVESCKKIQYMFPKAHAAAYVMSAVKLGWFKIYYPSQFYAALLLKHTANIDATVTVKGKDAVKKLLYAIKAIPERERKPKEQGTYDAMLMVYEAQLRGINFLPAFYKTSHPFEYTIEENGETPFPDIRLPYSAVEGCARNSAERLYEVVKSGEFICIDDIQSKSGMNKTVLENLNLSNFFGELPQSAQISLFDL